MSEREQLEREHVDAGIAKWGEAERAGLERQARAKSLDTLRAEAMLRRNPNTPFDALPGERSHDIATDALDDGHS